MVKHILNRTGHSVILIIAITMTIFILVDAMPGNELIAYLSQIPEGEPTPSREQIAQMQETLGLGGPWHERYMSWLGRSIRGDFGRSLYYRRPVSELVGIFIWRTFALNAMAMLLMFALAIPLGVRSATMKNTPFDHLVSTFSLVLISIPSFFIGIYLMRLLAVNISWLPATGMRSVEGMIRGYPSRFHEYLDILRHMIIPALALTLSGFGVVTRFVRNAVIDVINQDYIRTAKSKGLTNRVVIYKHAFRNALIPMMTLVGVMLPQLFIGNIFIEAVFAWPGIGLEFIYAVSRRDTNLLSLILLFFSVATILSNWTIDMLYGFVDPRMRMNGGVDYE